MRNASEEVFEDVIRKEVSESEFKDAHKHRLKRRFAEYYETQKRKWAGLPAFSFGYNPIEKFKDIPAVFSVSIYPEYVVVGPTEKEGIKHPYSDVINKILKYIDMNLVHPYLMDLLDRGEYAFYDNHIVVDVHDHREAEAKTQRVLLKGTVAGIQYMQTALHLAKADDAEEASLIAKTNMLCLDPDPEVFEVLKERDYNEKKLDWVRIDPPQKRKVYIGSIIKKYRLAELSQKKEMHPGLEKIATNRIYRTAKFMGGSSYYTINAVANIDHIEVVFRKGVVLNTAISGFITKRKFTTPAQIDLYVESARRLLEIYHTDLKCICDISSGQSKPHPQGFGLPSTSPRLRQEEAPKRVGHPGSPRPSGYVPASPPGVLHSLNQHQSMSHVVHPRHISLSPGDGSSGAADTARYSREIEGLTVTEPGDRKIWQGMLQNPPTPRPREKELDDFNFDYVTKKFV